MTKNQNAFADAAAALARSSAGSDLPFTPADLREEMQPLSDDAVLMLANASDAQLREILAAALADRGINIHGSWVGFPRRT